MKKVMMVEILSFLKTYKGRDRVLRLLCYLSKLIGCSLKSQALASQFNQFGSQISSSRACFRLLDDIPTIAGIVTTIRKEKERQSFSDYIVDALEIVVDLIFCPLDHISWAIDNQIIKTENSVWDSASTLCWVISLYICIYKAVVKMAAISKQKMHLKPIDWKSENTKKLSAQQWDLQMTTLKCIADLLFAVNCLPRGMLWAKFFNKQKSAALGTISSLIALYQAILL